MTTGDNRWLDDWRNRALGLEEDINAAIIGQSLALRQLIVALFSRGHVLLEGSVGVGKTTLLRALSRALGGAYERIEGTIDLMPADLIYHTYIDEQGRPRVEPGPLVRHGGDLATFFFNEVNRARPQVHSLLLRVMAERSLGAFNQEYRFPHLLVFADRNRVEKEETFELPSAARDRFLMEIAIEAPQDPEQQRALMLETRFHDSDRLIESVAPGSLPYAELNDVAAAIQNTVTTSDALADYALNLCQATHDPAAFGIELADTEMDQLIESGISPRGMSLLLRAARTAAWLAGRDAVMPEDIHSIFATVVSHRVFFTPVYEMRRSVLAPQLIERILQRVAAP